jgi:hypothetical protein
VPIIEDALTLAKTGRFKGAWEVEKALKHHGYAQDWIERQLSGRGMRPATAKAKLSS